VPNLLGIFGVPATLVGPGDWLSGKLDLQNESLKRRWHEEAAALIFPSMADACRRG